MNIYRIRVGRETRNGTLETLYDFVVNADTDKGYDITRAYQDKYKGFGVRVEKVEDVEMYVSGDETKVKSAENKTLIQGEKSEFGAIFYRGFIGERDIPDWDELVAPVIEAQKALGKAEEKFEKDVLKRFDLKGVKAFNRVYGGVEIAFTPHQFIFKSKNPEN